MLASDAVVKNLEKILSHKTVAIVGFAREGKSTYRFLRSHFPTLPILICDQNETQIEEDAYTQTSFGPSYLDPIHQDMILFKTPGITPHIPKLSSLIQSGTFFTSQTDCMVTALGQQMIAVTGTKGKSTTAHAIAKVLTHLGKHAILVGNIGTPVFDVLDQIQQDTFIIYEMSSHQAQDLHASPHFGVLLNLYAEHLDYYSTLQEYWEAKHTLFRAQTAQDFCIYRCDDPNVVALLSDIKSLKIGFGLHANNQAQAYIQDGCIYLHGSCLLKVDQLKLKGIHNAINLMSAILIASNLGYSNREIAHALENIEPLEGRLQYIATKQDVRFYDDALATIPEATIAALDTLGDDVETLIAGGYDRHQDFTTLAKRIADSHIKTVFVFPTTGERIAAALTQYPSIAVIPIVSMDQAVNLAFEHTRKGKIVLLSAASPSFGLFQDYRDRSRQYTHAISKIS